jgi:DNA-directed RNA polymerase specialized sigma24 family protein
MITVETCALRTLLQDVYSHARGSKAFEAAAARFDRQARPYINRFARRKFGWDPDLCDQIATDVILAVTTTARWDPERGASLRSWLARLTNNQIATLARRRSRSVRATSLTPAVEPPAAIDPDPLVVEELIRQVREALDRPVDAAVFDLLRTEDDNRVIARRLGLSIGQVYKARFKIRKVISAFTSMPD